MEQDRILYERLLLDELEEIIYVSDIHDYSLLNLNRAGRELTGLEQEDVRSSKCHSVLQGRDTPCPFCTNAKLNKDSFYVWEYENPHLNLQPKYNPLTGKVCSAEALVRYQAAGTEYTQPLNFVPLLEKSKLIRYLDFYMLEQVFKLLSDWKERGRELIPVSVNFSRITLLERDLFQVLTDMQKKYHIPACLVMIEITESIGDIERKVTESIGSKLREAGFRISLDDFGANYANMSILSIMQFDEVKLDKSLMDDLVVNRSP